MLEGKKVLITGHTGQIGGAVAKYWASKCELWGLARYSAPSSMEEAEKLGVKPVKGDFTTGEFDGVPDDFDYVLHFAADCFPTSFDAGMIANAEGTGLLMHHCQKAKAFLHVSTTGVYYRNPDHYHLYKETDRIGGSTDYEPFYGGSKAAAEGVVRALGRIYNLPTTIARMDVAYGGVEDGGLPGGCLEAMISGTPFTIPASWPCLHMPIHDDDIAEQVDPLIAAADVRSNTLNWGGDDVVGVQEFMDYMGELTGITPKYNKTDENPLPQGALDNTKKFKYIGKCKVKWKDGFKRMIRERHPELKLKDI